jgi:long-chain acyl-CoA synthetase
MSTDRFWMKSWDAGLADVDPREWETSYVDVVRSAFADYRDVPAFCFMGVEVTFRELDMYSNRFADMLLKHGFNKGDVIGINLPNIPEYLIAWLGALKAGCVVSGVSPLLPANEMEFQLQDSNARGLVTLDAIFATRLVGIASNLPKLKLVVAASVGGFLPGIKSFLGKLLGKIPKGAVTPLEGKTVFNFKQVIAAGAFSDALPAVKVTPDDIAYIQYTGGTTGMPKGAMLTHRNAVADLVVVQRWLSWTRGDGVALSAFPLFHIAGLFFCANCVFLGWTQLLVPNPRDTDHICAELKKYRPKFIANVPSLYYLLMSNPTFAKLDHSRLLYCISAAAPFPEESQKLLESIIGKEKLIEVYGMSETSPLTVMNPSKGTKKLGTIGLPILNTEIKLVDPGSGKEAARGEAGEICVRGPMVMKGYYNKPEETAHAIDRDGYMHTGDVAVQDEEGYLRIVDRTKDMINISGFKVFSKRVEEILAGHPAVEIVATIGVPNPELPGSEFVKAFVVLRQGHGGNEESARADILAYARAHLAPYEVPKAVEFRSELPLTTVGKIDKKALRKEAKG